MNDSFSFGAQGMSKMIALSNTNGEILQEIVNETIGDGAPKGAFDTLQELTDRYPKGAVGIYLVTANGHWYYWDNEWKDGGIYQATEVPDGTVTEDKLDADLKSKVDQIPNLQDEIDTQTNKLTSHETSNNAHSSNAITYSGIVQATNVKDAIDNTKRAVESVDSRVSTIIAHNGDGTKDTELIDSRDGKPTLGDRLNATDAKLAENAKHMNPVDIRFTNYSSKRPLISFIDDDGRLEALTVLKPLLDAKGWKAGSAIITGYVGNSELYMSWEQIESLYNDGWEILSHSQTHPNLTTLTDQLKEFQIKGSLEILNQRGFESKGFVYPFGMTDESTFAIANKYCKYAFGGYGQNNIPVNSMETVRITLGENESLTLDNFKSQVDTAINTGNWLVFCFHIGTTSENQRAILAGLLDYIETKDIDVVLPSYGYELFGNAIESRNYETGDYFTVSNNGETYSSGIYRNYQIIKDVITATTPITSFDKNKVSVRSFLNADAPTMPGGVGGTLLTYRNDTNDGLSYQEYYPIGGKTHHIRYWNTTISDWNRFEPYMSMFSAYNAAPTGGTYLNGDIALDTYQLSHFAFRFYNGGTWYKFGQRRVSRSITANRPVLTADDVGYFYMDNTLSANGKPIWWNGTDWIDATGTIV